MSMLCEGLSTTSAIGNVVNDSSRRSPVIVPVVLPGLSIGRSRRGLAATTPPDTACPESVIDRIFA
jgi:hypothetical protein